ncbi:MAG: hypothetical protein M3Q12_11870 [Pseudomonadota bacterium]|nr:hypothetical protein [Pseudomonadota bacterium]
MNNTELPQAAVKPALPRRQTKKWWHVLLLVVLIPLLCVAGAVAYELNREHFPRLDLPAFDKTKVVKLPPDKRAAYEQELFSELQQWNRGSRKYPTVADIARREQRWQAMADDGFELAHITLSVLKPVGGLIYSLAGPMKRLEELARQGDVGAMCLMPGLVGKASLKQSVDQYTATYEHWMQRGVELKHPECMKSKGGQLLRGVPGVARDVRRGLELQFAARRAGYAHDVGALILHYQDKGYDDPANVRRLYCWLQIEDTFWIAQAPQRLLADLKQRVMQNNRPELLTLQNELQGKQNTLQDCVELGTGE